MRERPTRPSAAWRAAAGGRSTSCSATSRSNSAIAFEVFPGGRFSDGALQAIDEAKPVIFRQGWLDKVFDKQEILRSVKSICGTL